MGTPKYEMPADPLVAFFANPEEAIPEAALHERGIDIEMLKSVYQRYVVPNIKDITRWQLRDPHVGVACESGEQEAARAKIASLSGMFCAQVLDLKYRSSQDFRQQVHVKVWLLRNGSWVVWSNYTSMQQRAQHPAECMSEWCGEAATIEQLIEMLTACLSSDMHRLGSRPAGEPAYFPLKLVDGLLRIFTDEEKQRAQRLAEAAAVRGKIATVLGNVRMHTYS